MRDYYTDPYVRARIIEFLGGRNLNEATCEYLSRCDSTFHYFDVKSPAELRFYFELGLDIGRSLWDREWLIVHLDIDYVNFDFPAEPYLDPHRTFMIQKPVEIAVEKVLLEYGIAPLHLISGRGHHFVWRIKRNSSVYRSICKHSKLHPELKELYEKPHPPVNEPVAPDLMNAYSGLGLLMEYIAHRIRDDSVSDCILPVEFTAVAVGPIQRGRELISIDISEYGDPLHTRMIRVPYTVYSKPFEEGMTNDPNILGRIPPIFMIPLFEMDVFSALGLMQDRNLVADLARRAPAQIPDQTEQMEQLISSYNRSHVKNFHDWFYSQEHEPPKKWPLTYDMFDLDLLPTCAKFIIEHPNDLLLKPSGLQLVTRSFLALGWHPRHIAGFIRSKYERDHDWGVYWSKYDPGTRADFYTRIFTGSFVLGKDDLIDFNCVSMMEKGHCFDEEGGCADMEKYRISLLERRNHERLASRPFNRLFLPVEHI